jgi:pectate lyase
MKLLTVALLLISPVLGSVVERQSGCTAKADGFASQNGGTTGGAAGPIVTVSNQADLEKYATASTPYVVKVQGRITITPLGKEIKVSNDKTIIGVGTTGEISGGLSFSCVCCNSQIVCVC